MSKTFLSIGSGPGIGFATALRFGQAGYDVVLSSRDGSRLAEQAKELSGLGINVRTVTVDASQSAAVAELVEGLGESLAVLHYNAAVLHYDASQNLMSRSIDAESVESLETDMQVNVTSALVAVQSALPALRANGKGSVLLTGGGFGVYPTGDFLNLSIGKAAIRAATQALFPALKAEGIHVASVTVSTLVSPDSPEAQGVADAFWNLHTQDKDQWDWEQVYPAS